MLSIVELKTMPLDYGIPGISPTYVLLLFAMMFALGMIPYAFLYRSLMDRKSRAGSLTAWVHLHRHPQPLHH